MSKKWEDVNASLRKIAELEPNWDGYTASAVSVEVLDSTADTCRFLAANGVRPPDDVYPLSDGNVILEWQGDNGVIQRLEVCKGSNRQLMTSYPDREPEFVDDGAAVCLAVRGTVGRNGS